MWSYKNLSLILATAANMAAAQDGGGSYWAIYNATVAPAADSCLVDPGTSVDEACCTAAGEVSPHAAVIQADETCFLLAPELPAFSGCVGDMLYGYGENCSGEGAPFVAENAAGCGCEFSIEGSGCYKANDLPGQQWFVFLDASMCAAMEPGPTMAPTADASAHNMVAISGIALLTMTVAAVV